jgi:hypothetical protein
MFETDAKRAERLYGWSRAWAEEFLGKAQLAGLVVEGRSVRAPKSSAPSKALQLGYIVLSAAWRWRARHLGSLQCLRRGYERIAEIEEALIHYRNLIAKNGTLVRLLVNDPGRPDPVFLAAAREAARPLARKRVEAADQVTVALTERLRKGEPASSAWVVCAHQLYPEFAASIEEAADEARFGPSCPG